MSVTNGSSNVELQPLAWCTDVVSTIRCTSGGLYLAIKQWRAGFWAGDNVEESVFRAAAAEASKPD